MLPSTVANTLCVFAGQLYPAYSSYKAVTDENAVQYHRWLQYWIVNAFFSAGVFVSDTFLWWLPFYGTAKLTCILWMVSPYTEGSTYVYRQFLQSYLQQHEASIERALGQVGDEITRRSHELGRAAVNSVQNAVTHHSEDWIPSPQELENQAERAQRLEEQIRQQRLVLSQYEQQLAQIRGERLNDPAAALFSWIRTFATPAR